MLKVLFRDFPGGPVGNTPRFHCKGHGFDPWSGKFHMPYGEAKRKKKESSILCQNFLNSLQYGRDSPTYNEVHPQRNNAEW